MKISATLVCLSKCLAVAKLGEKIKIEIHSSILIKFVISMYLGLLGILVEH